MRGARLLLSICFIVTALPGIASTGNAAKVTSLLRGCEGNSAQFVQRFLPKGFKQEKLEHGSVIFGKLPSMRWTYAKPETKEFGFDGTTSWLWVPADRQVTIHDLTADERAALPFFALSDSARIESRFTVTRNGRITTLKTRERGAMLTEVRVEESRDGRLASLRYVDSQGNATTFEFSRYAPSTAGGETFKFVPPPGTDVVRH